MLSLLIAATLLAAPLAEAAPLTPVHLAWLASAHRHQKAGWIALHVEGPPRQRGFQHGYLLAPEIREALRVRRAVWEHRTAMLWGDLLQEVARFMTPRVDEENREELLGIVDGLATAGVASSLDELVAYNGMSELEWYWFQEVRKKNDGGATVVTPPKEACSAFVATGSWTRGGGVVLGHNTMADYFEANVNLVLDVAPERGHRILMQAAPGWIHSGTDFFVTSAGLVGAETTIGGFHGFTEWGIPEFARMRRATQDAATIDEWVAIMKKGNNGGYANAWLLGDVNTGEIARLELGLQVVALERTKDGWYAGSNVAEDRRLLVRETSVNDEDVRRSSVARRVRWKELLRGSRGKIDLELAKAFEADHHDAMSRTTRPGGRSLCGHFELESEQLSATMIPYEPTGTLDAKVVDAAMAGKLSFAARWGAACGRPFDARAFLAAHPQYEWQEGLLKDRPSQPWAVFTAGER